MNKGTVIILAAVVLCAVYGVFGDEADCPDVDKMFCVWKQPVNEECRKPTYVEIDNDDGTVTKCPACDECLDDEKISVSQVLGLECPVAACSMLDIPDDCANQTMYTMKMDVDGTECTRCQTFTCD